VTAHGAQPGRACARHCVLAVHRHLPSKRNTAEQDGANAPHLALTLSAAAAAMAQSRD